MRKLVVAFVAVLSTAVLPARGGAGPSVETRVEDLRVDWNAARSYPSAISYTGAVEIRSPEPSAFASDTFGQTHLIELGDIAAPADTLTSFRVRGTIAPVKAELLGDAGVNFHVATLSPFGTHARFGQGAVGDLYFWGAAAAGSEAVDGNLNEAMIFNTAGEIAYPDNASTGSEGRFTWDRMSRIAEADARAFDPTSDEPLTTSLVAAFDAPILRVEGGDITTATTADPISVHLPDGLQPAGGLTVYQGGLPGVDLDVEIRIPGAPADLTELRITPTATPAAGSFWPQSADHGSVQDWVWRPVTIFGGIRREAGAASVAAFDVPMMPGMVAKVVSPDGAVETVGPVTAPSILHFLGDGRTVTVDLSTAPAAGSAGGPTSALTGTSGTIVSPAVRGDLDAGAAGATFVERAGVPVLADVYAGDVLFGDLAATSARGELLTTDHLVVPPQVIPIAAGDVGGNAIGGFLVQLLAEADGAMLEIAWVVLDAWYGDSVHAYVLDAWPVDGGNEPVDVDLLFKPAGDTITVNDVGPPVELITHEEFNGDIQAENRPDLKSLDSATGATLRYFMLTPTVVWQTEPAGAHGLAAILRDPDVPVADPISEVNGDDPAGKPSLYLRTRSHGAGDTFILPRTWIIYQRPFDLL